MPQHYYQIDMGCQLDQNTDTDTDTGQKDS